MEFLNALFSAALDQNIVYGQLVGMVAVILIAQRPQDAFRFGGALWAACFVSGLLGWPLYTWVLVPWGLTYVAPALYLLVGSAVIFAVGAYMATGKDKAERTHIYQMCTVLAVNAAVLAVPLALAASTEVATYDVAIGSAFGAGLGAFIAVVLFATIRDRIDDTLVPGVLRGLPISLITASLMALAFTGVAGIAGGMFV